MTRLWPILSGMRRSTGQVLAPHLVRIASPQRSSREEASVKPPPTHQEEETTAILDRHGCTYSRSLAEAKSEYMLKR